MFIYNFKINKNSASKLIFTILGLICISLIFVSIFRIIGEIKNDNNNYIDDKIPTSDIAILTPENYTNVLKEVHEDLNTYLGQKISFSGYVYRVPRIKKR